MTTGERVTIVVPGDDPPQIQGSAELTRLERYGDVALYTDRPRTLEEQIARAKDAVCLVNTRGAVKWPAEALRALPRLRMATVCGIGTDAFDLRAARELGIVVCNIPGRTAPIVAEHAFGLMLAAAKRAYFQTAQLKAGRWKTQIDNVYLRGKTLGIVGAGSIGAAMARLGQALGMDIVAWTFTPTPERAAALGVRFLALDELLRAADVVSLHVRLTPESRGLIGARELGLMKRGAILVNTARGAVVDEAALVAALRSGHLGAAALDVFDQEPLPADHPILGCEQVVLTPHNADQTPEGLELLNAGVVDNVIAFLEGRPQNVVT
ncbi:MAG TPA: NAD(P)-dependent oxidoreductase [Methylomirabilota bacterium]|jgi:D-3-phosphoglycerate dehydrogenase|nr:NAD(P)-dependent oxidoreductase [Methylomirabilota bacterium]